MAVMQGDGAVRERRFHQLPSILLHPGLLPHRNRLDHVRRLGAGEVLLSAARLDITTMIYRLTGYA